MVAMHGVFLACGPQGWTLVVARGISVLDDSKFNIRDYDTVYGGLKTGGLAPLRKTKINLKYKLWDGGVKHPPEVKF
jgi:hypothetical protein